MKNTSLLAKCSALTAALGLASLGLAHGQTTIYFDVNGTTAGFGDYAGYSTSSNSDPNGLNGEYNFYGPSVWTTDVTGLAAPGPLPSDVTSSTSTYSTTAVFDGTTTTATSYTIRVPGDLGGDDYYLGGLTLQNYAGTMNISDGFFGPSTLHFNGGTINTGVGNISINNYATSITGSFTKTGVGDLALGGSNAGFGFVTYAGTGTISAGSVTVSNNGATGTSSNFTLNGGSLAFTSSGTTTVGTLGGGGVGAITSNQANTIVASGLLPGGNGVAGVLRANLNANSTLDLSTAGVASLKFDLGAMGASDELLVTGGTVNLGSLTASDFSLTALTGVTNGTYTLVDDSAGLGTTGSVTGSSAFDGGTATFSNDGSNVYVTLSGIAAVPEPATYVMALLGGVMLFCVVRRQRLV